MIASTVVIEMFWSGLQAKILQTVQKSDPTYLCLILVKNP